MTQSAKLTQEEINNVNSPICIKEIESIVNKRKHQTQIGSLLPTFKVEIIPIFTISFMRAIDL